MRVQEGASETRRGALRRVFLANLILAAVFWLLGFAAFLGVTLEMDNDFARHAREHHQLTAVLANLRTLPGYILLALVFTFLGHPFLRSSFGPTPGGRWRRLLRRTGRLFLVNGLIFLASLGFVGMLNRGFLDALTRLLSKSHPSLSLYWMHEWRILDALAGLAALLALIAVVSWRREAALRFGRKGRILLCDGPLLLLLAPLLWAAAPHAPGPPRVDPRRPNVFILAADSLRADHLHCYGYRRETSPNIDALAREGVLFENLHVATASTLESWITILTSRFPQTHGIRYMFPSRERVARASSIPDTLPRLLGKAGYHTAVSSNWAGNCFSLVDMGFAANRASDVQNFDVFIAEAALMAHPVFSLYFNNRLGELLYPEVRQITSYLNPDALLDRYEEELNRAQRAERPFFGVLFTSHTHLPFAASYPWNVKWVDPDYRGPNRYQIDFEVDTFIQHGFRDDLTPAEVDHIRDLYDGCVSEFDDSVGRVLRMLQERGLYDDALIIVTSDHGDDLYDHETTLGHGTNFFGGDQTTRIPVIVKLPRREHAGTRIRQITRSVDLAPTILDLLGQPIPEGYEGVSLVPALGPGEPSLDLPAFAETCYLFYRKRIASEDVLTVEPADRTLFIDPGFRNNFVLKEEWHQPVLDTKDRMMRTPRWKLIWIPGKRGPIYRFFDMSVDPHQEHDLSGRRLPVMTRMIRSLEEHWAGRTDLRWRPEDDLPER